jgi:hypothetical protein
LQESIVNLFTFFKSYVNLDLQEEDWLSGLKRWFAKPLFRKGHAGSNPVPTA